MKTKELIRQLQENDPSGELECCVANADIHFVSKYPAYWDGCLQVLSRDSKNKCYNIVGAKYISNGIKVVIFPLSISDAIFDNEDLPVEYDMEGEKLKRYETLVEGFRQETKKICDAVVCESFIEYLKIRITPYGKDITDEEIAKAAEAFFENNLSHKDKMPPDIMDKKVTDSYGNIAYASHNDKRIDQWNREIELDFIDGKLKIKKV